MKLGYFDTSGSPVYFDVPAQERVLLVNAPGALFAVRKDEFKKWALYEYTSGLKVAGGLNTRKAAQAAVTAELAARTKAALECLKPEIVNPLPGVQP
jgi:hypothetical protein